MRRTGRLLAFICLLFGAMQTARATVQVHIDIDSQTMAVTSGSGGRYLWPVSTGMDGYATPRGSFRPRQMMAVAYSSLYNNAPMPHSIFFTGGYAIHGTYATGMLGRPASHGCVRLAPGNAATLFSLVRSEGAVISITGSGARVYTASRHKKTTVAAGYKHHRAVRVAKLHRAKSVGYLTYAPQARNISLKAWMRHPGQNF